MVGVVRWRLLTDWLCWLTGRIAEDPITVEEANPDDAATESSDIVVTLLLPFICLGQLENLSEETAPTLFSVAFSCQHKINQHY